ncbi:MAG: hypothetical protein ACK5NY_01545 [Burkholderiaceae bacterium]|jgi:hypothetical protein
MVDELNEQLRRDLGTKPLYAWKKGSDLFYVAPARNGDGTAKFEISAYRGDDGEPTGIVGMQLQMQKYFYADHYEKVRPGVQFSKRWVFCRLHENPMSPEEWREAHGEQAPWIAKMWMPVDISGGGRGYLTCGHLMSDPDQPVTPFLQRRAIDIIRLNKRFLEQFNARQISNMMLDETKAREERIEKRTQVAHNAMPVGGWAHTPGKKDHISFGTGKIQ